MEIKNIPETANRILRALRDKERIILYGDADMDGVGAVIIIKEALEEITQNQGIPMGPLEVFFPDREKEGYGINEVALREFKNKTPALLILLDCGMGNVEEVEKAKKMGFEVIIIDHHHPLPKIPSASLIVNPKQKGDPYPFKEIATAGLAYRLIKYLFQILELNYNPGRFLEIAMLATLADQMPLEDENRKIVEEGILALSYTKRPGLIALLEVTGFKGVDVEEVRKKLLFPLNRADLQDHLHEAFLLLTQSSIEKAKEMAKDLLAKGEAKRKEAERIYEEVELRVIAESKDFSSEIIFEGDSSWPLALLGVVASKICQKYQKPTFLFKKGKTESVGTVRVPSGKNGVEAMIACEKLLKTYGGHPLAGGFRVKNENLEKFKVCLQQYFKKNA